jgi:hypothetical protein
MRSALPLALTFAFAATGCFKPPGEAPAPVEEGVQAPVPASDAEARKVVEKGIAAHGGEAAVAKLRSMRIKAVGTAELVPGQKTPITVEDIWSMPDKYKSTSTVRLLDKEDNQTQVIDGDKGWIMENGMVRDLPKEALTEMKEQKYGEDFDRLEFLKRPEIRLSLSDSAVLKEPVSVVTVHSPGHRDVALSFSKKTGLLIRRSHPVLDPASGSEIKQDVIFSYFAAKDGVMHYRKIMAYRNDKLLIDANITEIEFLPKIDEKTFARPK